MPEKVSILMPVFNQIDFTKKAVESLYQFTDEKDFELIVVDNGSMDGTIEYLMALNKENFYFKKMGFNAGWCKGLNEGYKLMSPNSDFVLWANNDILFEKDWLPKMIAHFRSGVGAVGPTSNFVLGRQRVESNKGEWEEEVNWLIGFFLMFRRGVVDAIGKVDERFSPGGSEEWDYIIRMQKKLGLKCVIARDVYIHHFGSQTLKPLTGNTPEGYNDFIKARDKSLREKWGDDFINLWHSQKLSSMPSETMPWPDNCKLGWAMPLSWSQINSNTHLSVMAMKRPQLIYLESGRGGELDEKRERQIADGLQHGCTHFFICDADMVYPLNTIPDLFKVLNDGADLASGLCYRGYPPYEPVLWHLTEHRLMTPFKDFQFGQVVDASACGAACLLVKREVFEKIPRPWFQYKYEKLVNKKEDGKPEEEENPIITRSGEDYYFTKKATEAGFKLRIMTKYDIHHVRDFFVNRDVWLTHGLLTQCGDWGTIIALFKKLKDKKWIEREINGASVEIDWSINQKHYEISLLYQFLLGKKVKNVLEIGTQGGGTALLWAKLVQVRQGHVYCVDQAFQPQMAYSETEFKDRITEIKGDSHNSETIWKVREVIASNGGFIDFLFLDGDHTRAGIKADFEDYSPLVKPGGFIAFHDILDTEHQRKLNCQVCDFWNSIKGKFNHFEIIDPNDKNWMGIGVLEWKQ